MRAGHPTTNSARRTRATELARTLVTRAGVLPDELDDDELPESAAVTAVAREDETPTVLDRYRLRKRLGSGGFGTVWSARDERLQRDVAVKILPRELVSEGRFEREAHAAARLSHPGIVTLYEAAADDEGAYLVSELVRGSTLQRALAAGRLSDRDILEVGLAVCDALRHAHAHGVVHRDVKPSNILIPGRSPARTKLTDFGVARLVGGDTLTRTGDLVGTAAYMSPEQAEGREAGEASDLYALALVLYEALTGINPVTLATAAPGGQRARRLAMHLPPLRRQRRELPRELGQAIDLALRPRPRERGTLDELRPVLERAIAVVCDRPGVVQDAWPARGEPQPPTDGRLRGEPRARRERAGATPPLNSARPTARTARQAAEQPPPRGHDPERALGAPVPPLTRAWGAAAAAATAAWVVARLLTSAPLPPAPAALVAALAVVVFPRLGWIVLGATAVTLLAVQGTPGAAFLFSIAALAPVFLLRRHGAAWPLAAGAPLLGIFGLAGAWPAVAARARTGYQRAALGALGWIWVLFAAALARRSLYGPVPEPPGHVWASLGATVHQVLSPLVPGGALAGAVAWGLGAAALPRLTRSRPAASQFMIVFSWAAAVAAGTGIALRAAGAGALSPTPGRFLAGLGACAAIALLPSATARVRSRRKTDRTAARLA